MVTETLSDHRYITFRIDGKALGERENRGEIFPRWRIKNLDRDWFDVSVACGSWLYEPKITDLVKIGEMKKVDRILKRIVTDACDNSMSRDKTGKKGRNQVY